MIRSIIILLALTLAADAQPQSWGAFQGPAPVRPCIFCAIPVGEPPQPAMPREAGDIFYRHEVLNGTHTLRLSTTDIIIDNDAWREQRLMAFTARIADATCSGRFEIVKAVRETTTNGRYSFRCR